MCDFNEVRWEHERFSLVFNHAQTNHFNEFISEVEFVDIPLGGYMFTWSHSSASKMSKIDRFLISDGLLSIFPKLSVLILTRHLSDHKPLLPQEAHFDYEATPFRVFHSWFLEMDFTEVVKNNWKHDGVEDRNAIAKLEEIDKRVDDGRGAANGLQERKQIMKLLLEVDRKETLDLAQKAKVKWDIEGDENNKYFHEIINKMRRHLAIRGILIDGEWVDNPIQVKQEFYHHFATRFEAPKWSRDEVLDTFPNRLSSNQSRVMEEDVSYDEVKRAIWECGSDNTMGPDEFTFEFFKKFWYVVGEDVVRAVHDAKLVNDFRPISLIGCLYKIIVKILVNRLVVVIDDIVSMEQSAFIKGRQILDGPFILNEAVAWCKRNKQKSMVFKIDFQKAFDSVRWDFIDDILRRIGFGEHWRKWIQGCFTSCMGQFLLIDLPLMNLDFNKDCDKETRCLFGNFQKVTLSHLFYADDAIFIGKWSHDNVIAIARLLQCFYMASCLNVSFHKSTLLGIVVPYHEVECMASNVGCKSEKLPFNYLDVKISENMSRIESWKEVISKVSNKLSSWKIKTVSVGGRLTLLKSVLGSLPTYYMSIYKAPQAVVKSLESIRNRIFIDAGSDERKTTWISWKKVLASKREGSLRVNSIFALNHALLFKWVWRFRMQLNVIWTKDKGVDLMEFCQKKVGDGQGTRFWPDKWVGDQTLKETYPRIFALELDKEIKVVVKLEQIDGLGSYRRLPRGGIEEVQVMELRYVISSIIMAPVPDRWVWTLDDSRSFTVGSARVYIDKKLLISGSDSTRWCKVVPLKVNILAWRISLDKLPTRMNLDVRGFDVSLILCPIFGEVAKNSDHLFFQCSFVSQVYELFGRWWDIQIPMLTSF
ncbi:RNA-directed DNA polymerase, eukaryota [Tanacetum coccineum]